MNANANATQSFNSANAEIRWRQQAADAALRSPRPTNCEAEGLKVQRLAAHIRDSCDETRALASVLDVLSILACCGNSDAESESAAAVAAAVQRIFLA